MTRFEPSTSMKIWILEGKKLLKLWGWNPCSRTHCVILEHYYSVDFPWWFHRNFFCLSIVKSNWKNSWNQSVKKVTQVIWQNCFAGALKNVSKTFTSIWRPNAWMDSLETKSLLYQFLLKSCLIFFCQIIMGSPLNSNCLLYTSPSPRD